MKLPMAIAGVVVSAVCAALLMALRRAIDRRQAAEQQLAALAASIKSLQARVSELNRRTPPEHESQAMSVIAENDPEPKTLAVLAAAATAFLGKAAHIRSVSSIQPPPRTRAPGRNRAVSSCKPRTTRGA